MYLPAGNDGSGGQVYLGTGRRRRPGLPRHRAGKHAEGAVPPARRALPLRVPPKPPGLPRDEGEKAKGNSAPVSLPPQRRRPTPEGRETPAGRWGGEAKAGSPTAAGGGGTSRLPF